MVQKSHESGRERQKEDDEQVDASTARAVGEAALSEVDEEALDKLLNDIDYVLEENAEEFVASFVQRGGQ